MAISLAINDVVQKVNRAGYSAKGDKYQKDHREIEQHGGATGKKQWNKDEEILYPMSGPHGFPNMIYHPQNL